MPCVGIIGTGLIGASIGLAARERGWEALGYDRDPAAASGALRKGAIDRIAERDEIYGGADVVVIAAHVSGTLEEVASLRWRALRDDQLIIDVASVKAPIVRAADGIATFVSTHPMAGAERHGPDAARSDLFEGRIWCFVPTSDELRSAQARVFVEALGATSLAMMSADHDAIVALTSHTAAVYRVCIHAVRERASIERSCAGGCALRTGGARAAAPGPVVAANVGRNFCRQPRCTAKRTPGF